MTWHVKFRDPDGRPFWRMEEASDQAGAIIRARAWIQRTQVEPTKWGVLRVVPALALLLLVLVPTWASAEPANALLHTQETVICLGWDTEYEGCVPFPHVVGLYLLDVGGGWFRSIKLLSDGSQIDEGLFCLDDRCRS